MELQGLQVIAQDAFGEEVTILQVILSGHQRGNGEVRKKEAVYMGLGWFKTSLCDQHIQAVP